jgi:hypothetical protein
LHGLPIDKINFIYNTLLHFVTKQNESLNYIEY